MNGGIRAGTRERFATARDYGRACRYRDPGINR